MFDSKFKIITILLIGMTLFNITIFNIPYIRNDVFWIMYSFSMFAFILQFYFWLSSFSNQNSLKNKFLQLPILSVSTIFLVVQLFTCFYIISFLNIENWIAIIICSVILGITFICLLSSNIAIEEVIRIENKVNQDSNFINSVKANIEILILKEENEDVKKALSNLFEQIRFSDPISNEKLKDIENNIENKVTKVLTSDDKTPLIREIEQLLTIRNNQCKYLK